MKLRLFFVLYLFNVFEKLLAVKKMMHPAVNICNRHDPNISECYCKNFVTMVPFLKNGVPEMGILPVDPYIIEKIILDFSQTQSVNLVADLHQVVLIGLSNVDTRKCFLKVVPEGVQITFELFFPLLTMHSDYSADGKFLVLKINTVGDFDAEYSNVLVKSTWNSTKYMKKGKEHLRFDSDIKQLTMEKITIHFNRLFGNNTELNESINQAINENIDVLYDEMKPVIIDTINAIMQGIINGLYAVFPYDVLFPEK